MEIGVITNPHSRKNRGRPDRADRLRTIVGPFGEVHETASPEAIKPLLREFLRRQVPLWVADGGDGALHWMVRAGLEVLQEDEFCGSGASLPAALPTKGGTIDFVANNVGIKGDAESILTSVRHALERGQPVETSEVKAMLIEAVEQTADGPRPFTTIGFAAAVGGVGQRFFSKYYEASDPCPREIVNVVARTVASFPVASTPLRNLPGVPQMLRTYAREMFEPTVARLTLDGEVLPQTRCTGIHVASMSINLGNVLRFFSEADDPEQLHAICGAPHPWQIIRNLPRMWMGKKLVGDDLYDGPTQELMVEAIGDELLCPIIDGECYSNISKITFRLGPRLRIARVEGRAN